MCVPSQMVIYSHRENIIDNNENVVGPKFKGICKSKKCQNKLVGIATEKPTDGKLHLTIKTRNARKNYHEENKRPLNGPKRKIIGRELKRRRAAGFRQQLLADNMEFGQITNVHGYRRLVCTDKQKCLRTKKIWGGNREKGRAFSRAFKKCFKMFVKRALFVTLGEKSFTFFIAAPNKFLWKRRTVELQRNLRRFVSMPPAKW